MISDFALVITGFTLGTLATTAFFTYRTFNQGPTPMPLDPLFQPIVDELSAVDNSLQSLPSTLSTLVSSQVSSALSTAEGSSAGLSSSLSVALQDAQDTASSLTQVTSSLSSALSTALAAV